jgi:hypothetical protein
MDLGTAPASKQFAVVGLRGVRYRRDVSASLTQLVDERQLDFIPAFERIVQLVNADRNATSILPKVVRAYCAAVCRRGLSQSHLRFVSPHAVASEGDSRKRIFSNPDQKATEE